MERTTTSPELSPTRICTSRPCCAPQLLGVAADGVLHGQGRVAGPHGVVLVRQRRAEERHDPVAQHLVHGALVAVDGLHHAVRRTRVEQLAAPPPDRGRASSSIEPFRSANSTVTCLRSPSSGLARVEDLLDEMDGRVRERGALVVAIGSPVLCAAVARPDQHLAVLVGGHALRVDELGLQVFQVVVVELEPALERPVGYAPLALQQLVHLCQDLLERHRGSSPTRLRAQHAPRDGWPSDGVLPT